MSWTSIPEGVAFGLFDPTALAMYTLLASAQQLSEELSRSADGAPLPVLLDCSFDLADPEAGQRAFEAGHLPGARYVHLETTLSGTKTGMNGRHPLPEPEAFAAAMAACGVDDGTRVVAYDRSGGNYAARLWWMLRWVGHRSVAVLDGGLAAWIAMGHALSTATPTRPASGRFTVRPSSVRTVGFAALLRDLGDPGRVVIDARAADRFCGENEMIDPVAGHIPGARNRPFSCNLRPDGRFKSPECLRSEFAALLAGTPPDRIVSQCGSGVTACHNLLAFEVAGLHGAALYPGSWSEWCAQPNAPVARGPE